MKSIVIGILILFSVHSHATSQECLDLVAQAEEAGVDYPEQCYMTTQGLEQAADDARIDQQNALNEFQKQLALNSHNEEM